MMHELSLSGRRSRNAPPRASAMVEALRGLGYSPATAIADIIDNSIAAGASEVDLGLFWHGEDSFITIQDNGLGMDANALDKAMRLGERSPLEERSADDLGRFGLGLKTASFSQARRLTVASRQEGGEVLALHWDLNVLRDDPAGAWSLLEGVAAGSQERLASLEGASSGTLVLWELMDRIVPSGIRQQDFLDLIDRIERHLAMVFHRFIEKRRLVIRINGRAITAWNPFLEHRSDTWRSGTDTFLVNGSPVSVEGFVLPHGDRLDAKTRDSAAGPDGWTAQQGFYVYRNERLLVAGNWLGLGKGRAWTKEEPFRLARIRLDLPNTADPDWTIDIRKSTARPPVEARMRLSVFAEDVRERARKVFAFRGKPATVGGRGPVVPAWRADRLAGGIRYRIEADHPAVAVVLEHAGPLKADIVAMLAVIEATVPVQQIWLDTAEAKDTPKVPASPLPSDAERKMLETVFRNLISRKGYSVEQARSKLRSSEPFDAWPDLIDTLVHTPSE